MRLFAKKKAAELVDSKQWINSRALKLADLRGKVILLDFWTYSCINCLRTLPALKAIWRRHAKKGLVIIGIHTPEFEFEKDLRNVKLAVERHKLDYPIMNDPKRVNWDRYGNMFWPRSALIDKQGNLVMEHIGESGYDEIEERIRQELRGEGAQGQGIKEAKRRLEPDLSQETYAGSLRNRELGSGLVCTPSGCNAYLDAGPHLHDTIYVQGEWKQHPEFMQFLGKQIKEGHMLFRYNAKQVNLVMEGKGSAEVLLDGKPIAPRNAGRSVTLRDGKSFVKIDRPDMYELVNSRRHHSAELTVKPFPGLKIYAYTFG